MTIKALTHAVLQVPEATSKFQLRAKVLTYLIYGVTQSLFEIIKGPARCVPMCVQFPVKFRIQTDHH